MECQCQGARSKLRLSATSVRVESGRNFTLGISSADAKNPLDISEIDRVLFDGIATDIWNGDGTITLRTSTSFKSKPVRVYLKGASQPIVTVEWRPDTEPNQHQHHPEIGQGHAE